MNYRKTRHTRCKIEYNIVSIIYKYNRISVKKSNLKMSTSIVEIDSSNVVNTRHLYVKLSKGHIKKLSSDSVNCIQITAKNIVDSNDVYDKIIHMTKGDFDKCMELKNENSNIKMFKLIKSHIQSIENGNILVKIPTRGDNAGGANTNKNGKPYEEKVCIEPHLMELGFIREKVIGKSNGVTNYRIVKEVCNQSRSNIKNVTYLRQNAFRNHMISKYGVDITSYKSIITGKITKIKDERPDECFIIEYNDGRKPMISILEMKYQDGSGTVYEKLKNYEFNLNVYKRMLGDCFDVHYAFCVSKWLKEFLSNDFLLVHELLIGAEAIILYGDDDDYREQHIAYILRISGFDLTIPTISGHTVVLCSTSNNN